MILYQEKKVLVSGAAGSIGSEIVRQLLKFKPDTIYALEIDETELHDLELEISRINIDKIRFIPILCDVRNEKKLEKFFLLIQSRKLFFHAAAYKHVPLTEEFPDEAVTTNILGTAGLAGLASKYGVEKFVNISTDKAVNPTSLMGATKRIAELVCIRENSKDTNYVSVRFGNVLGSRGSVLTIFQNQIKNGGPVTITHRDMERYFMSIPEAVLLVFQAASMGEGGEVFILDMGKPKKDIITCRRAYQTSGL